MAAVRHLGFVMRVFRPPTEYLVVFITVRNLVGITATTLHNTTPYLVSVNVPRKVVFFSAVCSFVDRFGCLQDDFMSDDVRL